MTRSVVFPIVLALAIIVLVQAENPYKFFELKVTYGEVSVLTKPQRAILINGQFPGPQIDCVTNDNLFVNVINELDEPFLITWHGVKQRKMSWQDGVLGTNCPIPPGANYTYKMQTKDQIGTFMYYPSTAMHRVAGGFGAFIIHKRSVIPKPYPEPADEFTVFVNDWYQSDHKKLQKALDKGKDLKFPNALLINGRQRNTVFTGEPGKTYLFRVINAGTNTSINIRFQDHAMKLVEVEGSHVLQETYQSLDLHVGQSAAFLVTLSESVKDYYIVATTCFTNRILKATAILNYVGSNTPASGPLPSAPADHVHWSIKQARTIRLNLTANAARPNPQGSFHYGTIPITRNFILENSRVVINGRTKYAVNGVSYVNPSTPLKLADYYKIPGVFNLNTIPNKPRSGPPFLGTSVFNCTLHDFIEIVFQNNEDTMQSWHFDGYSFWVVGYGSKQWNPDLRKNYNLADAPSRSTVQVYPKSWTAILASLDNKGMWNLRSSIWDRRYLGQEVYIRNWSEEQSLTTEADIPDNVLKCGKAVHL